MMKMLQKILSHGLLIAVIVAAFFIYTNRAELMPNWFGKTETAQVGLVDERTTVEPIESDATPPTIQSAVTAESADETAPVAVESAQGSTPEPEAVSKFRPLEPAEQQAMESSQQSASPEIESADSPTAVSAPEYRPLENEEVSSSAVTAGDVDAGVSTVPADIAQPEGQVADSGVADQEPATAEKPATEQPAAVPEATDVAALDTSSSNKPFGKTVQQQLEEARQLYWQQDVSAATEAYEALGRDNPLNADIWGEIGNFYYSIQQLQPAGTAYYRTVSLLIDKGDTQKARQLLGVLYELDANRGRELDARLQQSVESTAP